MSLGEIYVELDHLSEYFGAIFGKGEEKDDTTDGRPVSDLSAFDTIRELGLAHPLMAIKHRKDLTPDDWSLIELLHKVESEGKA